VRFLRVLVAAALTLTLTAVGVSVGTLAGEQSASAAPVTGFDPGNIISDATMYNSTSMTTAQVQTFLEDKGAACAPTATTTCIKSYRETTPTRPATTYCPSTFAGSANDSAASIISKVAVACGINPQVLLVTLQKEQGLITSTTGKTAATYARALGYGCPDNVGGWCDPAYAGFANQVYSAARQLKVYQAQPTAYSYRAGRTNYIQYHPNTACGSTPVYIQNQATAALYIYTPYVPNAAALAAGSGNGDSCSSYGNRNFYLFFTSWFGSTRQNSPPSGNFESLRVDGTDVVATGWTIDADTPDPISVHVYVDGALRTVATAGENRPDVGRAYGQGDNHGFSVRFQAPAGDRSVCVYAISVPSGVNPLLGCRTVSVPQTVPFGRVESVAVSAGDRSATLSGWALDPETKDPIAVHVYIDGVAAVSSVASGLRTDVGRVHGMGDNHGFSVTVPLTPGTRTLCVYAIKSRPGVNPSIGCSAVTLANTSPRGNLESLTTDEGDLVVSGWVVDQDTRAPVDVHAYVDGRIVSAFSASTSRPDVGRIFGLGDNHGFYQKLYAGPGPHTVCLFAINIPTGVNPQLGCASTTISNSAPTGRIESASASGGMISVTGWTYDPDTRQPIDIEVTVDGGTPVVRAADSPRPDVDKAFGMGPDHGFVQAIPASPGNHTVCVSAIDSMTKERRHLGCSSVTLENSAPTGALLSSSGASLSVTVNGWALDADESGPVTVGATVDGRDSGVTGRADRAEPAGTHPVTGKTAHGYTLTVPATAGARSVCVYAVDTTSGTRSELGCTSVAVPTTPPVANVETIAGGPGRVTLSGWAFDRDRIDTSIGVHVYATDTRTGLAVNAVALLADRPRPDVARAFGIGDLHGFDGVLYLAPGSYTVCAYGIDVPSGLSSTLRCSAVAVS